MLQIRVFRPPSTSWCFSKLSPTWLISLSRVHYINLVLSDALCNIIVDPSNSLLPPRKATFVSGGVPTRNAVWSETLETGPFAIVNVLETWISKKKKNTLSHPQPMTLWYCGQKPCRRRTGPFAIVIVHSTRHQPLSSCREPNITLINLDGDRNHHCWTNWEHSWGIMIQQPTRNFTNPIRTR